MKDAVEEKAKDPIPYYPSRRLLGLELEFDAAGAAFHKPLVPNGWESKPDGSLNNGEEYVLEPPLPVIEARAAVETFSAEVTKAKMHLGQKGGFHIHVQIHDYTQDDAARLAQLYWKFQDQINLLVAPSRRTKPTPNSNATPYDEDRKPTKEFLVQSFNLNEQANNRVEAKLARQKMVLNFAMMRCRRAMERTVEFRQPSPSKKTINIYGWAVFATGLVELARNERIAKRYIDTRRATWKYFLAMCRRVEKLYGARDLVNWVKWRRDYLNNMPGTDKAHKLYGLLVSKPHGLFYIARKLNINVTAAKQLVASEVSKGRLVEHTTNKWRVKYDAVAKVDAERIIALWQAQEQPAQRTAVPTVQATNAQPTNPVLPEPVSA